MADPPGDFDALGRELRQRVGGELRADAEELEALAAQQARRRATLIDLARVALARGDQLAVHLPSTCLLGTVWHADGDLLSLRVHERRVDVCTDRIVAVRTAEPGAPGSGHDPVQGPSSFKARLFELEMAATPVEVVVAELAGPLAGTIRAVAADHIALTDADGGDWAVALRHVTCVRS